MDRIVTRPLRDAIVQLGWASTDISREYIHGGVVAVNDVVIRSELHPVDVQRDEITLMGICLSVPRQRSAVHGLPAWFLLHDHDAFGTGVYLATATEDNPTVWHPIDLPLTHDYLARFDRDLIEDDIRALQQELSRRALIEARDVTVIKGFDGVTGRYLLPNARYTLGDLRDGARAVGLVLQGAASLRCGPYTATALPPASWRRLLPHEVEAIVAMAHYGLPETTPVEDVWQSMRNHDRGQPYETG